MPNTLTDAPIASHTLAQDQPLMEANNAYYGNTLFVDHQIGPANGTRNDGLAKEGYHKVIHYVTTGADPVAIAGVGQLYTLTGGTGQTLKYRSGNGAIFPITGPNAPVLATIGYTWISGGLLMQWGFVNGAHAGGVFNGGDTNTVSFPINFPNNIFSVWTQSNYKSPAPSSQATVALRTSQISNSGFEWTFVTNSAQYNQFLWVAIGN